MGGIGAELAFGANAVNDLRDALIKRLTAQQDLRLRDQQATDHAKQQDFENQMRTRTFDSNEELKRAQLASLDEERKARASTATATEQDRHIGLANSLDEQIPAGTFLQPTDPAIGMLRTGGRGSALTPQQERPRVDVGPLQPGDTGAPRQEGYIKAASFRQMSDAKNTDRKDWETGIKQELASLKSGQQPNAGSYQLQPEIDPATGKQTGRYFSFNTKANSWSTVGGQGPGATKAEPGAAQAANQDRSRKDAVGMLGQLDQAIDNAKDLIGPGEGRISNLEQMAGNADPRIQALGVKMKAVKMAVDHAITGSVRAGASPTLLQQWDNILANKITPEGLKAGVQAMREILGGGQPAPSSGVKVLSITPIK